MASLDPQWEVTNQTHAEALSVNTAYLDEILWHQFQKLLPQRPDCHPWNEGAPSWDDVRELRRAIAAMPAELDRVLDQLEPR